MPDMAEFLDLPPSPSVLHFGLLLLSSSLPAAPASANAPMDQQANTDSIHGCLNWNDILADPSLYTATASPAGPFPSPGHAKAFTDWNSLGPAFWDAKAKINEHELNPSGIPDTLQMMIHLKLFIPLSLLTSVSLTQI